MGVWTPKTLRTFMTLAAPRRQLDVALLFVCCLIRCKHLRLSDVNKHTCLLTYLLTYFRYKRGRGMLITRRSNWSPHRVSVNSRPTDTVGSPLINDWWRGKLVLWDCIHWALLIRNILFLHAVVRNDVFEATFQATVKQRKRKTFQLLRTERILLSQTTLFKTKFYLKKQQHATATFTKKTSKF